MHQHGDICKLHECPCKGHHVDACLETVMQFGQGQNTAISQENIYDRYGPLQESNLDNFRKLYPFQNSCKLYGGLKMCANF